MRIAGLLMFSACVVAGTVLDSRARERLAGGSQGLLVADLHVHPYPGDGSLTVWQLQREAARRGVDVMAITSHNHRVGLTLARLLGTDPRGAIVLPGQEVTSADYHMIAAGTGELIDWRLSGADAIEAVQRQGGVAIAAHPVDVINAGWDPAARALLDGAEIMHPLRFGNPVEARELDVFFDQTRMANPSVASIGSTDFHMSAPLGLCRTYVLAAERTADAALAAIREGRTAAACGGGELIGAPEHVAVVHRALSTAATPIPPSFIEKGLAFLALAALALLAIPSRR